MRRSKVEIPQPATFSMDHLFEDNFFKVPMYQRNYAWENDEIDDFISDLSDIVEDEKNNHFFGQLVTFRSEDGRQEIIDGQQRLTTSLIFCAVIKEIAKSIQEKVFPKSDIKDQNHFHEYIELSKIIETVEDIIWSGNEATLIVQARNKNGANIQKYFQELTTSVATAEIYYKNNKKVNPIEKMHNAYNRLRKAVQKKLEECKTWEGRITVLKNIFYSFTKGFYVVMLSTPDSQEAFTIFETLNSRGKDLNASDIIKNHLMSIISSRNDGTKLSDVNKVWNEIAEYLNNDSAKLTKFIRTYWSARARVVSEAKLYRAVSQHILKKDEAERFLKDLRDEIELYSVLLSPRTPKGHKDYYANIKINERIDILNRMNVVLYYPIMFAMWHHRFNEKDVLQVLQKIISVFIRHRTISSKGTNVLETGFASVAQKIWSLELGTGQAVVDELNSKLLSSDKETQGYFNELQKEGGSRGAKKWTIIYLLSELYSATYDDFVNDDLYQKVFDEDKYQPAHISESKGISNQNYLGNWTIIEKEIHLDDAKDNDGLVAQLKRSQLNANKILAHQIAENSWDDTFIEDRQTILGRKSTVIW